MLDAASAPPPHSTCVESLPEEIGALTELRSLALRGNRLGALPPGLGRCAALEECDCRDNRIAALPPQLGQLTSLKLLLLDNNRLVAVPPQILKGCSALATLGLHGNALTAEALRETPGWAQFDERRRAKYDKQVGAGGGGGGGRAVCIVVAAGQTGGSAQSLLQHAPPTTSAVPVCNCCRAGRHEGAHRRL